VNPVGVGPPSSVATEPGWRDRFSLLVAPSRWGRPATWFALVLSFAAIAALRLAVLFSQAYPPGADTAEQLYWTHLWLGTAFPSPVPFYQALPVYLFTWYLPFTRVFPLFTGMRLLMGITPALLVFPTYRLLRVAQLARSTSLFGANLTALVPTWSVMLSWNGGFSLFSFVLAVLFFAFLVEALQAPSRNRILGAGITLALVAGSHYYTFLFVVLTFAVTSGLLLLLYEQRRRTLVTVGKILGLGAVCTLPFALCYEALITQTYLTGGPSQTSILTNALTIWSPINLQFSGGAVPILFVLVVVTMAGAIVCARRSVLAVLVLSIVVAGAAVAALAPQEDIRAAYFLPLGLGPGLALLAEELYRSARVGRFSRAVARLGRWRGGALVPRPLRSPPVRRAALPATAVVLVAGLLLLNGAQSVMAQQQAQSFYDYLNPAAVEVLDWIATHTNLTAVVLSTEISLVSWIQGYANRQTYTPSSLGLANTRFSYNVTYWANLASLGQYVAGDSIVAVATNVPSEVGSPLIFVRAPYAWFPFLSTNDTSTLVTVVVAGTPHALALDQASVLSYNGTAPCAGCAGQSLTFKWAASGIVVVQDTVVNGTTVSVNWSSPSGIVRNVTFNTGILPSGQDVEHVGVAAEGPLPVVNDTFELDGAPFSVALGTGGTGPTGNWTQQPLSDGWANLTYEGKPRLSITFDGLEGGGDAPYSYDASQILKNLQVTDIVVSEQNGLPGLGYNTYKRCLAPGEMPGYIVTESFVAPPYAVFSLTPG
jgi:hypothetical protein